MPEPFPYSAIVAIVDVIGGEAYVGSGVLITPDEVLTASHVVYTNGIGLASEIAVVPGYNGETDAYGNLVAPYGIFTGAYVHDSPVTDSTGYITLNDTQNDFALIHLTTTTNVGNMHLLSGFNSGEVLDSGYPGSANGAQVTQVETVSRVPGLNVLMGTALGPGSSGGPDWFYQDGQAYVVGLNSSYSGTTGYSLQITGADINVIDAWAHMDDFTLPLVDNAYYDMRYPDVAAATESPSYHYDTNGWHEGRDPDALFSTTAYLDYNTDVAQAGIDPAVHYDEYGWREGRDPSAEFDTSLYLLHNPDVRAANIDPLTHYLQYGRYEGRAIYPVIGPEDTSLPGFDPEYYLLANPDVAAAHVDPLQHFLTYGWKEGRNPDAYFNTDYYLAQNPDVKAAGIDPLVHYDDFGWHEGRNPSMQFDTNAYLAANPDVAAAGFNPLLHYLEYGAHELRAIYPVPTTS